MQEKISHPGISNFTKPPKMAATYYRSRVHSSSTHLSDDTTSDEDSSSSDSDSSSGDDFECDMKNISTLMEENIRRQLALRGAAPPQSADVRSISSLMEDNMLKQLALRGKRQSYPQVAPASRQG
jgi:hypothetical protein